MKWERRRRIYIDFSVEINKTNRFSPNILNYLSFSFDFLEKGRNPRKNLKEQEHHEVGETQAPFFSIILGVGTK